MVNTNYIRRVCQSFCSIIIGLFVIVFVSCNKIREKGISDKINKMGKERIIIPFDKMSCYSAAKLNDTIYHEHKYKYILFADSNECSSCVLNSLYDYTDYIAKITKGREKELGFYFIFSPKHKELNKIKNKVLHSNISYPVYIDSDGVFAAINSNIPSESIFHTFMIDNSGCIVLVGNPIKNEKIDALFRNRLDELLPRR